MLYLLLPSWTLQWVNLPATSMINLWRENGTDLSVLPWEPAERKVDNRMVRWAIRHGIPCGAGLVLHAGEFSSIGRADEMRETFARYVKLQKEREASPINDALERIIPGNTEEMRRLNAAVDASTSQAIEEAEAEEREAMDVEPRQELVKHWTDLGGRLPIPR